MARSYGSYPMRRLLGVGAPTDPVGTNPCREGPHEQDQRGSHRPPGSPRPPAAREGGSQVVFVDGARPDRGGFVSGVERTTAFRRRRTVTRRSAGWCELEALDSASKQRNTES